MKELTIEQKAQRYDEILARAKGTSIPYYKEDIMSKVKEFVDYLLPELAESEDEKIRKEIIKYLEQTIPHHHRDEVLKSKEWIAWLEKQGERKPAEWGEEDEKEFEQLLDILHANGYESFDIFLKSLKNRVQSQTKQKWSEDVEAAIRLLKNIAEEQEKDYCPNNANDLRKAAQYLETCRPQPRWKPSDEQIRVLDLAIRCGINRGTTEETTLVSLFNDLKKLREE